jgi:hypothetical protein
MEYFFQEVGRHNFPGKDNKYTYCPKFTSAGKLDCPVCELVDELYKAGDKASKELAKSLRTRRMYWMNIIVRDKNGDQGPFIYTPGVMVFGDISNIINDPDYGDVTDPDNGFDISIDRTGTGQTDTDYDVRSRRNPSPLSEDAKQAQEWLDAAKDLSYVELTDSPEEDKGIIGDHKVWVSSYDRIVKDFDLDAISSDDDDDDDVEEEEEEKPAPKAKATATAKKSAATVEEEDDDVEEKPVRKTAAQEVSRRMARRRTR